MLEHIQRLPIEVIQAFLKNRNAKACGVSPVLAEYILQINDAYNLNKRYRSISDCANQLRLKYPELSLPTCKSRVHDAISFFNADCGVTADAWDNYFADRMAQLFEVNLIAKDRKEARICSEREREYRLSASQNRVDPRLIQFKPQIVSADMQLDRMGVTPKGILSAWEKAKSIINSRDVAIHEKKRILIETARELNVKDKEGGYTEYEEVEDC
ncbi:MAG: hypothetical protein QM654_12840 [Dysgonamonadaceae bacterium]